MNLERLSLTYSPILLTQFNQFRNPSSEVVWLTFSSFLSVCGMFNSFIKLKSFSYFLLLSAGQQKSTLIISESSCFANFFALSYELMHSSRKATVFFTESIFFLATLFLPSVTLLVLHKTITPLNRE